MLARRKPYFYALILDLAATNRILMKTIIRLGSTVAFLAVSMALLAQTTFCLSMVEVSNTPSTLTISIQASASADWYIGSGNFVFQVDPAKLDQGVLASTPLSAVSGGPPFFGAGYTYSLTSQGGGRWSFNHVHEESFFLIPPGGTEIAQVTFNKLQPDYGDIIWRYTGGTTETVAFELAPGGERQIFATDPSCLSGLTSVPLPVELLSFNAEKSNKHSFITWETASEVNNAGFWLEHSLDGGSWDKLSWIDGEGEAAKYNYLHEFPIPGSHYYRLRQVDHDGTEDFSDIRTLTFDSAAKKARLVVWPNPTSQVLHSNVAEATGAVLTDQLCREVWSGVLQPNAALEVSSFAEGIYYLKVGDEVVKVLVGM